MKISILGTGMVGQTIAGKLAEMGHEVVVGTRHVDKTLAHTEPNPYGLPAYSVWQKQHPNVRLAIFSDSAKHGEIVINVTLGSGALEALALAGASNLNGKVLIDTSNPLDYSQGMPPTLFVNNTDSLGEQIQRAYPLAKVVKTLNTVNASLMVNPRQLADGDHHIFISGNDAEAKAQVASWLMTWFGWKHIMDLGDISTARGTEMYLPLWLRFWGVLNDPIYNIKVVKK